MNGPFDAKKVMELVGDFQRRIAKMNEELGRRRVEADSGAGMVRVTANGRGEILDIKIDPVAAGGGDVPMLEDLVKSAVNEALRRAKQAADEEKSKLTGGIPLPFDIGGMV